MDLSPRQRLAVFAVIVVVLAALGYYLVDPLLTHHHGSTQAAATASAPDTPSAPAASPSGAPTATAPAASSGSVNIYNWLPFTQQDLTSAAAVAVAFSVDYNTFTYTENAADYIRAMGGLVTGQLATTLRADYQTPGVAKLRTSQKQVSTGTAAISSLRAYGTSSLTFIVTAGQRLATASGTSNGSTQYAITVTNSAGSWQVSGIELESAGNS